MRKLKKKWLSRALSCALAVTLTAVMTPVADIVGIPTSITASAVTEQCDSFSSNGSTDNISVSSRYGSWYIYYYADIEDYEIRVELNSYIDIKALNGEPITKIVLTVSGGQDAVIATPGNLTYQGNPTTVGTKKLMAIQSLFRT